MNTSLLLDTPPPILEAPDDHGDDDNLGKIVVFGDDEKTIEEVLNTARMMAESIWKDTFSFYTSTDIGTITDYLSRTIIKNPKLLTSLIYLTNQGNVDDCLASFMSFLNELPGFGGTGELQKFISRIEERSHLSSFGAGELEQMVLRHEPKSRATRKLICGHVGGINLAISGGVSDLLLDRYADIGRSTLDKFIGLERSALTQTHKVSSILIRNMTDFTLFPGED